MTISSKLICPMCGAKNNSYFVRYYGDLCHGCDFDIKEYINSNREEKKCPDCNVDIGEIAVWCWSCRAEIKHCESLK